jgi:hypothetical protein
MGDISALLGGIGQVPIRGGAAPLPGGDHWAPKYLIGNVAAGDPAVPQAGAFRYIPDPGDGSGIALALAEIAGLPVPPPIPGDVWIRPGTYTRPAGSTPLAIPAGTLVRGAGPFTTIVGAPSGDQGVFTLAPGASLRDLNVTVPASAGAGGASLAAISLASGVAGTASLRDVNVTISTTALAALREAVRVAGPSTFTGLLERVTVTMLTATGTGSPTVGFRLFSGILVGEDLVATGGDHALRAGGAPAIVSAVNVQRLTGLLYGAASASSAGVLCTDNMRLRVLDGRMVPSPAAVSPLGYDVTSGTSHLLRACSTDLLDIAGGIGMRFLTCSDIDIDDCEFNNCAVAIRGTTVNRLTARACLGTDVRSFGVDILNGAGTSINCHVRGCHFELNGTGGATPIGVSVQGTRHEIEGNTILQGLVGGSLFGIRVLSAAPVTSSAIVRGNNLRIVGGSAIFTNASRTVISDNIIEQAAGSPAGTPAIDLAGLADGCAVGDNSIRALAGAPGIRVATDLNTIGDNTITNTGAPASPGISLLASSANNTCIGNVCEGAGATPVLDTGALNDVAHNIGV